MTQADGGSSGGWMERVARVVRPMRRAAPLIGLVLLVAAIGYVVRGDTFRPAFAAMANASPAVVAGLLGSMLLSVGLTGTIFWILTRRFGAVPFVEMQALMASTTLANYLPLRPGLFGRIAYHKARHSVRARDSLRTVFEAMGLSVACLVIAFPAILVGARLGVHPAASLAAPMAIGAVGLAIPRFHLLAFAWMLRYAETLLTALRYHLSFALIGVDVPVETSVAVACVSMAATLVPFVSNGIGLREWAIGLLAPVLSGYALQQGIVAELVQRAFEIAVVVPTGLLGGWYLLRRGPGPAPS